LTRPAVSGFNMYVLVVMLALVVCWALVFAINK
jgi:hypothetical protein